MRGERSRSGEGRVEIQTYLKRKGKESLGGSQAKEVIEVKVQLMEERGNKASPRPGTMGEQLGLRGSRVGTRGKVEATLRGQKAIKASDELNAMEMRREDNRNMVPTYPHGNLPPMKAQEKEVGPMVLTQERSPMEKMKEGGSLNNEGEFEGREIGSASLISHGPDCDSSQKKERASEKVKGGLQ